MTTSEVMGGGQQWILQFCHGYDGPFLDCARQYAALFAGTRYKVCTVYLTGAPSAEVEAGSASDEVLAPVMQRRIEYLALAAGASVALLCFGALLIVVLARQRAVADALASSEGLFRATFHQAATGIAHITPEGRILRANDKFWGLLVFSAISDGTQS